MALWTGINILVLLVVARVSRAAPVCEDIDTQACVLLAAQRPDFCKDEALAGASCPRYCNMCPLECYHCNTTVTDFHMCNTTRQCEKGQLCMRKQLSSTVDGHQEYQLTCESKEVCDGLGLILPFGKRQLETRDISVACCHTDRCNYPATTTTTTMATTTTTMASTTKSSACKKDVLVIVDESNSLTGSAGELGVFLADVFSHFAIGQTDVLMSLATFSQTAHTRWDLDGYTSGFDLSRALQSLHLNGGSGDLNAAISYAYSHVNSGSHGNRPDAPDVVLIITDDDAGSHTKELSMAKRLHQETDNIIAIGIGRHISAFELAYLASGRNHEFMVRDPHQLTTLDRQVAQLICDTV